MAEAIDHSLRFLTPEDLRAIAVFLKTVTPIRDPDQTRPAYAWGRPAADLDSIRGVALPADPDRMTGPQLYDAWCASCHQSQGQGSFDEGLPPLFHNTALGHANTDSLAMVVLEGIRRQARTTEVLMPGFARELSNQQIATLGSYLTQRWGNPAAVVSAEQVADLRKPGVARGLILAAQIATACAAALLLAVIITLVRRRRARDRA
jgi:mono/diheme cytochrome c family protein